jgi:thiamine transport system substrate-binding protein
MSAGVRILVTATDAFGGRGGIAQYNRHLLQALNDDARVGAIVLLQRASADAVERLPPKVHLITAAAGTVARYALEVARALARRDAFDLVVCGHVNLLPFAALAAARFGAPLVLMAYGVEVWRAPARRLSRLLSRRVDGVVSISVTTRDRMLAWLAPSGRRTFVVPNAFDPAVFAPGPRPAYLVERYRLGGRRTLLILGRMAADEREKGFDEVLEATPLLLERLPDLAVILAGDGDDRPRLERKARDLGVSARIVFTGYVSEAEKADLYRLADVFILPSRQEGFGFRCNGHCDAPLGTVTRRAYEVRPMSGLRILALGLLCLACTGPASTPPPTQSAGPSAVTTVPPASAATGGEVVLLTHDSFAVSDSVIDAFQDETGFTLKVLRAGDAGAMVNQAILTKNAPLADALYGVDSTFLSRAQEAGIFDPAVPVSQIDYGDVCVNFDRQVIEASAAPATIDDLVNSDYEGSLVVENPATSSPGLAFMLATIAKFGEIADYTWLDYWADLRDRDVLIVSGWEEAYYSAFSGGSGEGDRPLVVSYATSPAAEVFYADPQPAEAPTGVIDDGCFRQIEYAGVLNGARNPAGAKALVDFMRSPEFQADIPLNMFVFPALPGTELPDVFVEHSTTVSLPLTMDPAEIADNRERWLQDWTDVVLH